MPYRILADLVVLVHLLFIVFVVLGGFLALCRRRVALFHLPALFWGLYVEFTGQICPLTPLENHWRSLAGREGYPAGFVDHYLVPIIYPAGLTSDIQVFLGLVVLAVNAVAYAVFLYRCRPRGGKKKKL